MPYIAHAGIKLKDGYSNIKKDEWHFIKTINDIEYRWRLTDDSVYDVIAGLFSDRIAALDCAKQLYVALLYDLLRAGFSIEDAGCRFYEPMLYVEEFDGNRDSWLANEEFFFWNKKKQGAGRTGPGVFEVENDIEEFAEYKFFDISVKKSWGDAKLDFESIDTYLFKYSREAQGLLNTVVVADSILDFGLQMTLYCGLLEHLAENAQKEPEVLQVLDQLINNVEESSLSLEQKQSLQNFLTEGKRQSSRKRIKALCQKYAKPMYNTYSTESIIGKAYSARSAYSHGNTGGYSDEARYIKFAVLDVIKNYLREKEGNAQQSTAKEHF
jgi:hypothetical protein